MNTSSTETVTVLLVDDHAVVREGYRRLLERSSSIRVVGEAGDAQSAYAAYVAHRPQVTVMDIALPGASGIEALRRIRARDADAGVLMFSMYEDPIFAARSMQAGALGYVSKAAAPEVLVEAVLSVARGKPYLATKVAQELALRQLGEVGNAAGTLSPREFEILRMLAAGHAIAEIARSLGISAKTVANHQSILKQKLGAGSAIQLLQAAERLGISVQASPA